MKPIPPNSGGVETQGENWVDRMVAFVSPERALRRMAARRILDVARSSGRGPEAYNAHDAARSEIKTLKNWAPRTGDADADTLGDLETIRDRSRDAIRNQPMAAGAVNNTVDHVVGTGLRPQSRVKVEGLRRVQGATPEVIEAFQREAEFLFWHWASKPHADGRRTLNFDGLSGLAFRSVLGDGDCFVQYKSRPAFTTPLTTCIQLVEADFVSNPYGLGPGDELQKTGRRVYGGVEKNRNGVPVAYWVSDHHPGDVLRHPGKWTRMASVGSQGQRVFQHLFNPLRIGQSRGIPWLAPAIHVLKILKDYSTSEATAALISSMFSVLLKSPQGDGFSKLTDPDGTVRTPDPGEVELRPGLVAQLPHGFDVETVDPARPNRDYEPFVMAQLRELGVSLGLPLEVLTKHFQSSYSAARAALLDAWRFFFCRRKWLVDYFCCPVWEAVITEGVARGLLTAPGFFDDQLARDAWLAVEWTGDAPGQIDPYKEAMAQEKRLETGVTTLQEETAASTGGDWERKHAQRAKEVRRRVEDGLEAPVSSAACNAPEPPPAAPPNVAERPDDVDNEDEDED